MQNDDAIHDSPPLPISAFGNTLLPQARPSWAFQEGGLRSGVSVVGTREGGVGSGTACVNRAEWVRGQLYDTWDVSGGTSY